MINKYLSILLPIFFLSATLFGQTSVEGKLTDEETGEPILFGQVALFKNGVLVTGSETDFDGNYSIANIDGGVYDIEASYIGYSAQRITDVQVTAGRVTRVDFKMGQGLDLDVVTIVEYKKPLIDIDNTSSGGALTSDDIEKLSTKNINALASLTAGLSSSDGGAINARGSRSSGTDFYLDGIRVSGELIPQSEIEQLTSLIGGIPASYGDVTGAVISLTSKGPSSKLSGGLEVETSEFLDDYGYNLISGNLSGPIAKNKEGQSVIGFRINGQYRYIADDNPSAVGVYRASEEYINELRANPLNEFGEKNIEFDQFEENGGSLQLLSARPNLEDKQLNMGAKIDFRIAGNLDISLSAGYIPGDSRFTPGGASNSLYNTLNGDRWATYNWTNNPHDLNTIYRGNVRIKHRLGKRNTDLAEGETRNLSSIRNVSYTITGGFQRNDGSREDLIHEDRIFEYGYLGSFETEQEAAFGTIAVPINGGEDEVQIPAHIGYNTVITAFNPNTQGLNTAWLPYNNEYFEDGGVLPANVASFNAFNGGLNSLYEEAWGFHTAPGAVYNQFYKDQADRYTIDVRTNFDFIPGSSEKGRHSIEIGFLYEQRESRLWRLRPVGLYSQARNTANALLIGAGVDRSAAPLDSIVIFGPDTNGIFADQVVYVYPASAPENLQESFFKNVRDGLGVGYDQFVNVDNINPADMRLEWFEPDELTENLGLFSNILDYYGYDYLGNKVGSDVTFDDFFLDRDNNGKQDFAVAAFQPNYLSAFIQDKFSYKDIIFRLGVRMERYDANTKVMKDPYSLYEIMTADEFAAATQQTLPQGVQDDYKVYVEDNTGTKVKAYRKGDQWFDATGSAVNDGTAIFGTGGIVNPYYKLRDDQERDIRNPSFANNIDGSFEDYEPELNFAPRLSFSFPISEASNFFANYDVLYQRPTTGVLYTAMEYYYFESSAAARTINENPNLKPSQTTQYEIGFNQKVSNSSAVRIQAFYKEERDRVQARTIQQVASPIGAYTTYDNIDFATIKGFSFTYDLRRTGNILALANYTLQFADGTGSDSQSQRTLSTTGQNIRTLSALSFDERHRFNLTLDYRYGSGKKYNGPRLFGADILANTGANIQVTAVSGRPFTKAENPNAFAGSGFSGGLNEARRPWTNNVDMRIDKDFTLFGGDEDKKPLSFNVYLRVQNLFDTRNVTGVYTFTGDPEDSGYLAHPRGVDALIGAQQREEAGQGTAASFLDLYQAAALAPGFYALPRRIYLGAYFNF